MIQKIFTGFKDRHRTKNLEYFQLKKDKKKYF